MKPTLTRTFIYLAGILLLAGALGGFITNWATLALATPRDPIFAVSVRLLFWIVGGIELVVAFVCLFGRQLALQLLLILWLSMNLIVYHASFALLGVHGGFTGYLANASNTFGVSPNIAETIFNIAAFYMLIGASVSLLVPRIWNRKGTSSVKSAEHIKIACSHCGGRIAFPDSGIGQKIPCPHCSATITLQRPPEALTQSS